MVDFVPFTGLIASDNNTVYPANYMVLSGASGAVNVNTNVYVSSGGNIVVGGSTAPAGGNSTVVINSIGTNGAGIELVSGDDASGVSISGLSGGGINFNTFTGAVGSETYTERMRIDASGQVGINTTVPSTILDVRTSTQGTDGIFLIGPNTSFQNGNMTIRPNNSAGANNNITQAGDSGIIFGSNAGVNTGNLIIAPWNNIAASGMRMNANGRVMFNTATIPSGNNVSILAYGFSTNAGGIQLAGGTAGGGNVYGVNGGGLVFGTYTGAVGSETYTERMRIDSAGNVGINTTTVTTGYKLEVAGLTRQLGNIVLDAGAQETLTAGFLFTAFNLGNLSGASLTPNAFNGNYQYASNNGAGTINAPTSDCAIDILISNTTGAAAQTLSGFTVVAGSTGDTAPTTSTTAKWIISIRRINAVPTYVIKVIAT